MNNHSSNSQRQSSEMRHFSQSSQSLRPRSVRELCPDSPELLLPAGCPLADGFPGPGTSDRLTAHIIALGDVGSSLLLGLRLLGADVLDSIGIYDMNENIIRRYEMEMNQIGWPFGSHPLPDVKAVTEAELLDCDIVIFCASKAVPPVGAGGDVRMAQFEANRKIASYYGNLAGQKGFKGIFAVVSDPVDPLCKEVLLSSGLHPSQVRGYGLGVMNKRAEYFARKDERFSSYLQSGRAFGPHGADLVIANSITDYDEALSDELTKLTVNANMAVRELGFKPYIAPALSSGAVSLLLTLQGRWNYSSVYMGNDRKGAFLGIKNRIFEGTAQIEDLPLSPSLYCRIERAYDNLLKLI